MSDTLHNLLERDPFQPFRIMTTGGTSYDVADPHLIVVMRTQVFYCWPKSDRHALIPLRQIASVELLSAAA